MHAHIIVEYTHSQLIYATSKLRKATCYVQIYHKILLSGHKVVNIHCFQPLLHATI